MSSPGAGRRHLGDGRERASGLTTESAAESSRSAFCRAASCSSALIADPRWPHFATRLPGLPRRPEARQRGGGQLRREPHPLPRQDRQGAKWEAGIQAGVFSFFDLDAPSSDLVNADYIVGLVVGYRHGRFSALGRLFHQSSHLGDEYLLSDDAEDRVNLSYQAVDLRLSYEFFGDVLRLYVGGGDIFAAGARHPETAVAPVGSGVPAARGLGRGRRSVPSPPPTSGTARKTTGRRMCRCGRGSSSSAGSGRGISSSSSNTSRGTRRTASSTRTRSNISVSACTSIFSRPLAGLACGARQGRHAVPLWYHSPKREEVRKSLPRIATRSKGPARRAGLKSASVAAARRGSPPAPTAGKRRPLPDRRHRRLGRRAGGAGAVPQARAGRQRPGLRRRPAPGPDAQGDHARAAPALHPDEGRAGQGPDEGQAGRRLRDPAQQGHVHPARDAAPLRAGGAPRPAPPHRFLLPLPGRRPAGSEHRRPALGHGLRRHAGGAGHQGEGRARARAGSRRRQNSTACRAAPSTPGSPTWWRRRRSCPGRSSPTSGSASSPPRASPPWRPGTRAPWRRC